MTKKAHDKLDQLSPSGLCQMGDTEVRFYKTPRGRLWMDKKMIELVLTGKNQHNLLGSYKDPKNHCRIFDTAASRPVDVISPAGVKNYLKDARTVCDENRRNYYEGLKSLEQQKQETPAEPLQMAIFNTAIPVEQNDFVRISKDSSGELDVEYFVSGNTVEEKNRKLINMLLHVANGIADGSLGVKCL